MKLRRVFGRISDDVSIRGRIESGPQEGVASAKRTVLIWPFQKTLRPAGSRRTDFALLTAAHSPFKEH
jgi:hypothetical protein